MLPDSGGGNYAEVLKSAFAYWYRQNLDDAPGQGVGGAQPLSQIGGIPPPNAQADVINTTRPSLDKIIGCDDEVYDRLISGEEEGADVELNTKTKFDKIYWNREVRYDENTKRMQYKNKITKKWEDILDPTDKENYTKYFNTQKKCFNSFFRTPNHQDCCDLMKHLMNGDHQKFLDSVSGKNGAPPLTFDALDTSFREVNPYTVVKFLEGFGFRKVQEYIPPYGTVNKFPCYSYWKKNILKTLNLTTAQKTNLETMPNLDVLLDMSVA
jgi:putative sterol carrier protein